MAELNEEKLQKIETLLETDRNEWSGKIQDLIKDIRDAQRANCSPQRNLRRGLLAAHKCEHRHDQHNCKFYADLGHVDFFINCATFNHANQD